MPENINGQHKKLNSKSSNIQEKRVQSVSGLSLIPAMVITLLFVPISYYAFSIELLSEITLFIALGLVSIVGLLFWFGLYKVEPNQSAVLSLFGKYIGTVRTTGLRFNNPFYSKETVSLRVRNFESGKLKVNELV